MKIVPAILAETFDDFLVSIGQAERFAKYIQIDVMDGKYVPTKSFSPERINSLRTSLSFEIHLMVKDPLAFMTKVNNSQLKKVIFHIESDVNHLDFINQMKENGTTTGMSIKPETAIDKFNALSEHVDTLLFLTVDPGYYGSPFQAHVLKKIEMARKIFPDKIISVDGGVSLDNLSLFKEIGVDAVCVGSRIFLEGIPGENYMKFINRVKELEGDESI